MVQDASALGQAKFVWAFKYNAKEASLNPIWSRSLHIQTGPRERQVQVGFELGLPMWRRRVHIPARLTQAHAPTTRQARARRLKQPNPWSVHREQDCRPLTLEGGA